MKQKKLKVIFRTLLFLVILFLPTQLGKHFWPEFSLIFSLKMDYLSPTIYFWDLLVILFFILILKNNHLNQRAVFVFLIFLLSQVLSLTVAKNLGAGLFRAEQFLIAGLFGISLASLNLKENLKVIKLGLSLSFLFISLLAIGQFTLEKSLGFWILGERTFSVSTPSIATFTFYNQVFLRPYSTFPHPNLLAAFFIIVPLVLLLKLGERRINFLNEQMILLPAFFLTILTFSRTAIFVLVLELLFFLKKGLKFLLLGILVCTPLLFIRFSSAFNFDSLSFLRREELALFSLDVFQRQPMFGVGLNNFISQIAQTNLISGPSRFIQPVHNIFLLDLSETGIIGFLGLLIFISYPLFLLLKNINEISKPLIFAWCAIIFLGMFDHYFLTLPQGQRLLFLIWGLSLNQVFNKRTVL